MDAERGTTGNAIQEQNLQDDVEIKARIQGWVASSMCWCDVDDKVYCTPCEIMIDALDRIEYLESLVDNKVSLSIAEESTDDGCGNVAEGA